MGKPG
jgi:hypothetical protein